MHTHEAVVNELRKLLKKHKDWEGLLVDSLHEAKEEAKRQKLEDMKLFNFPTSTKDYFEYLDEFVRWIPNEENADDHNQEVYNKLVNFYWLIDHPSGLSLQKKDAFVNWMVDFANDWGSFLNTPESINEKSLQSFIDDPKFHMDQFMMPQKAYTPAGDGPKPNGPSGWQTFNQFFAREVNPGLRPVAGTFSDSIIVSPADSTFKSKFKIDNESVVTFKLTHSYKIPELLAGSDYKDKFRNGFYMHSFLGPSDYHRFHAPVRGTVLESRAVQQKVFLNVVIQDGQFEAPDGAGNGYEFSQTRGILILDSPIGLVAVIPIGMAQVSSVNMTAVEGAYLNKGDEFGYFMFGGSDIILLFQENPGLVINAAPGIHYNAGMCIGEVAG